MSCENNEDEQPKYSDEECKSGVIKINVPDFSMEDLSDNSPMKPKLQSFASQVEIIIHTCNDREYWAAIERLDPPSADGTNLSDHPIVYPKPNNVIGLFAGYKAAVVRTPQGNECRPQLMKAVKDFFPGSKMIIGAGIAYSNSYDRKYADVLISKQIEKFISSKHKDGDHTTTTGPREAIDQNIQEIFLASARNWSDSGQFLCTTDDKRASQVHIGCIVSTPDPTLVKDEEFRDQLMKHTPYAIGGEMEGWVLLELKKELKNDSSSPRDVEVIIIKGVADYGDCRKRDEWQWTAVKAAVDCIHYCLEKSPSHSKSTANTIPGPEMFVDVPEDEQPKYSDEECKSGVIKINVPDFSMEDLSDNSPMKPKLQSFASQVEIIIHTCNDREYWAAIERLDPPSADGTNLSDHPIVYPKPNNVIGLFAGYKAAVVRTPQGNECRPQLMKAVKDFFPGSKMIIGAGIAYSNSYDRKYADVLISKQIEKFISSKHKDGDHTTTTGPREAIDQNIQEIFLASARNWSDSGQFLCTTDDKRASQVHIGCIVSIPDPTLVKDEEFRDQLMKHTPYAIGGEMEGWVLLELKKELKNDSSSPRDVEVIIIKGVADYGDCRKRDEWQWTAVKAAVDCIHYCLEKSPSHSKSTANTIPGPEMFVDVPEGKSTANTIPGPEMFVDVPEGKSATHSIPDVPEGTSVLQCAPHLHTMSGNSVVSSVPLVTRNGRLLQLNYEVLHMLKSLEKLNKPIGVLAVIGPYRSGKSYLLSYLLDEHLQKPAFSIGHSQRAHTQGIWIATTALEFKDYVLVLLDTEGIGDVQLGKEDEIKPLITLTILISSYLIYNTPGVPTQSCLQDVRLFANLSSNIFLSQAALSSGELDDLKNHNPDFLWILRDFNLELEDDAEQSITPTEYLVSQVLKKDGNTDTIEMALRDVFHSLECEIVPHPHGNPCKTKSANEEFKTELAKLKAKLFNCIKPKKGIVAGNTSTLTGPLLASLVEQYTAAINKDTTPEIKLCWEKSIELCIKEASEKMVDTYKNDLQSKLEDKLPLEEGLPQDLSFQIQSFSPPLTLVAVHLLIEQTVIQQFRTNINGVIPLPTTSSGTNEAQPIIKRRAEHERHVDDLKLKLATFEMDKDGRAIKVTGGILLQLANKNITASREKCEKEFIRAYQLLDSKLPHNGKVTLAEFQDARKEAEDMYHRYALGPAKQTIFEQMGMLLDDKERSVSRSLELFEEMDTKRKEIDELQRKLSETQKALEEMQQEHVKRLQDLEIRLTEKDERIKQLEKELEVVRLEISKEKENYKELEDTLNAVNEKQQKEIKSMEEKFQQERRDTETRIFEQMIQFKQKSEEEKTLHKEEIRQKMKELEDASTKQRTAIKQDHTQELQKLEKKQQEDIGNIRARLNQSETHREELEEKAKELEKTIQQRIEERQKFETLYQTVEQTFQETRQNLELKVEQERKTANDIYAKLEKKDEEYDKLQSKVEDLRKILDPPNPPQDVVVDLDENNAHEITLKWKPPEKKEESDEFLYEIETKFKESAHVSESKVEVSRWTSAVDEPTSKTSCTISNLKLKAKYAIRIRTLKKCNNVPSAWKLTDCLTNDLTPGPPVNFHWTALTYNMISLAWDPPTVNPEAVVYYIIEHKRTNSKDEYVEAGTPKNTTFTITDLEQNTTFFLRVTSVNSSKNTTSCEPIQASTRMNLARRILSTAAASVFGGIPGVIVWKRTGPKYNVQDLYNNRNNN